MRSTVTVADSATRKAMMVDAHALPSMFSASLIAIEPDSPFVASVDFLYTLLMLAGIIFLPVAALTVFVVLDWGHFTSWWGRIPLVICEVWVLHTLGQLIVRDKWLARWRASDKDLK